MSETKICLSFDDGRADNIRAAKEILLPENLPATFNIATGYVDGTCPEELKPCENPAMTVEELKELAEIRGEKGDYLFEIAAHGDYHKNTREDIESGIGKLKDWLGAERFKEGIGFASPNSNQRYEEVESRINEFIESKVNYVRIGPHDPDRFIKRLERKLGRETLLPGLFLMGYKDTLLEAEESSAENEGKSAEGSGNAEGKPAEGYSKNKRNPVKIYESIPVMKKTSVEQVKALIKKCEKTGKSAVLMFHSIVKKDESYYNDDWSYDYEDFEKICHMLAAEEDAGRLKVVTNRDMMIPGKE